MRSERVFLILWTLAVLAASVPLNLHEGAYSQGGNVRARFHNALGSAAEVRACLDVAEALGYVEQVDPALRDKYAKLAMQYNAAAAQGDSTAIQTMQDAMAEEVLPSKEDSAKVWKDCGQMPPVSADRLHCQGKNWSFGSANLACSFTSGSA